MWVTAVAATRNPVSRMFFSYLFYIYNITGENVFFSGICLYPGVLPRPLLMSSLWDGFIFPSRLL